MGSQLVKLDQNDDLYCKEKTHPNPRTLAEENVRELDARMLTPTWGLSRPLGALLPSELPSVASRGLDTLVAGSAELSRQACRCVSPYDAAHDPRVKNEPTRAYKTPETLEIATQHFLPQRT